MTDRSEDKYEQQKAASREWKRQNKERHAELARAYRKRNPEKTKAQNQLNYAVRMGRIKRGLCEGCGTCENVHAHHDDYSKPLDVRWLCYICHRKTHPVGEKEKQIKFSGAKRANLHGESNPYSKLTEKDVKEIRALLKAGISQERIAYFYGVHQTKISSIKRGETWSHI